ncbi:hypothetical protein, partial [Burkholderia cenocepacia]|uniref:hypothetical protein n=1 Tax=Burkholderia cenocepacia TaxID=95486 RepID=UPI001BA39038
EVRPEYERNSPRMSSNSYVNLKIATCLVRYADDRLIDQRFPNPVPIRQIPRQYAKSTDQYTINQTKSPTLVIDSNQIARAPCGNDA